MYSIIVSNVCYSCVLTCYREQMVVAVSSSHVGQHEQPLRAEELPGPGDGQSSPGNIPGVQSPVVGDGRDDIHHSGHGHRQHHQATS